MGGWPTAIRRYDDPAHPWDDDPPRPEDDDEDGPAAYAQHVDVVTEPRGLIPPRVLDGVIVAVIGLSALASGAAGSALLPVLPAIALQVVPLLWRRRHPLAVALVVAVGCLASVPARQFTGSSEFAVPVVLYSVAAFSRSVPGRRAVATLAAVGCVIAGVAWSDPGAGGVIWSRVPLIAAGCAVVSAAAWAFGIATRRRRELMESLAARAEDLAREQEQKARIAAQEDRASIAREMHDIVAHSLAVVVLHADGASYAAGRATDPRAATELATAALDTIAATARDALAQTRRLVAVLRDSDTPADLAPSEGLADLPALVAGVQGAGLDVTADLPGSPSPPGGAADVEERVDAGTGLVAYRIVQEGLTNVLKHAGPNARARVRVALTESGVEVSVTDDGRGASAPDGGGHGLAGMRERVEVVGGWLRAGPAPGGGFAVTAHLPIATTAPARKDLIP